VNHTFWFYDYNECGEGGVGVINNDESSNETLAGFLVCDFVLDIFCHFSSATRGVSRFCIHTYMKLISNIIFPAKCHTSEWHEHFRHHQHQLSDESHNRPFTLDQSTQIGRQPRVHSRCHWRDPIVHCEPVSLERSEYYLVSTNSSHGALALWALLLPI